MTAYQPLLILNKGRRRMNPAEPNEKPPLYIVYTILTEIGYDASAILFSLCWLPERNFVLSIAFLNSSYPAKFIAPRGATQKNRGKAPLKRARRPSSWRMVTAAICIVTSKPWGAVIILVLITSKGVVRTEASPPVTAPTRTVSHGSSSRQRSFWIPFSNNKKDREVYLLNCLSRQYIYVKWLKRSLFNGCRVMSWL